MHSDSNSSPQDGAQKRVSLITGDPEKAIRKLSGPMIIAMVLMMVYNLVDSIWVAGLGANALAALGFISPVFMILIGLSNGLGAGASSAIARCIGSKNKKGADNAAIHSILISVGVSLALTIPLLLFLPDILLALGAGESLSLAVDYGQIIFAGTIFLIFTGVSSGILRAEGDVKRAMYAMAASAIINMVLDPILIYWAGWGIAGAAWATVISSALVSAVIVYWLLLKRDTYVSFSRYDFQPSKKVLKSILLVGLPASAETLVIALLMGILNGILVITGGTDAVAIYTAGWRVVMVAIIPSAGIGTALITVAGAAYGAKMFDKLSISHLYSVKLSIKVALLLGVITYIFAPYMARIFAYSPETSYLAPTIALFLQVMCFFYLLLPLGIMSSSIFQAIGKGITSLVMTLFRELACIILIAYLLAIVWGWGPSGVWWGIVIGNLVGSSITHLWTRRYIKALQRTRSPDI
ncbi:MATE family efflux transporter [Methanobacterium alkalithermotolerans]|uniref:MATE family efflux transporter n=1 Tax=Methanobacterium alkalithermotolerans TaxID=2731220 RepID=A0A8T8K6H0_9EURY|nr:MATE family efflux transporter [Methanobacterium alkalithermotolerans]QUH22713.1 MATE family efflux transporter [Methanobacterium alkalithermotolerans]